MSYEIEAPRKIDKAEYWDLLEMFFPQDWTGINSPAETFKVPEPITDDLRTICCALTVGTVTTYWRLQDSVRLTHAEIVAKAREAAK